MAHFESIMCEITLVKKAILQVRYLPPSTVSETVPMGL